MTCIELFRGFLVQFKGLRLEKLCTQEIWTFLRLSRAHSLDYNKKNFKRQNNKLKSSVKARKSGMKVHCSPSKGSIALNHQQSHNLFHINHKTNGSHPTLSHSDSIFACQSPPQSHLKRSLNPPCHYRPT